MYVVMWCQMDLLTIGNAGRHVDCDRIESWLMLGGRGTSPLDPVRINCPSSRIPRSCHDFSI